MQVDQRGRAQVDDQVLKGGVGQRAGGDAFGRLGQAHALRQGSAGEVVAELAQHFGAYVLGGEHAAVFGDFVERGDGDLPLEGVRVGIVRGRFSFGGGLPHGVQQRLGDGLVGAGVDVAEGGAGGGEPDLLQGAQRPCGAEFGPVGDCGLLRERVPDGRGGVRWWRA